jgi:hypothetical protein
MSVGRCTKCGGRLWGDSQHTWDCTCICPPEQPQPNFIGWECPRCRKIHSPFSLECDCTAPSITKTTFNTELIKEEQK